MNFIRRFCEGYVRRYNKLLLHAEKRCSKLPKDSLERTFWEGVLDGSGEYDPRPFKLEKFNPATFDANFQAQVFEKIFGKVTLQ